MRLGRALHPSCGKKCCRRVRLRQTELPLLMGLKRAVRLVCYRKLFRKKLFSAMELVMLLIGLKLAILVCSWRQCWKKRQCEMKLPILLMLQNRSVILVC
uniref:Uncharacterized protein n=1 Tax=Arundo donax TaxID=35708 RepID=A0A0A9FLK1_ARUDO